MIECTAATVIGYKVSFNDIVQSTTTTRLRTKLCHNTVNNAEYKYCPTCGRSNYKEKINVFYPPEIADYLTPICADPEDLCADTGVKKFGSDGKYTFVCPHNYDMSSDCFFIACFVCITRAPYEKSEPPDWERLERMRRDLLERFPTVLSPRQYGVYTLLMS